MSVKIERFLLLVASCMSMETVTIPKQEYEELKKKVEIDEGLLHDLIQGLKDIKEGRIKRVR